MTLLEKGRREGGRERVISESKKGEVEGPKGKRDKIQKVESVELGESDNFI